MHDLCREITDLQKIDKERTKYLDRFIISVRDKIGAGQLHNWCSYLINEELRKCSSSTFSNDDMTDFMAIFL